MTPAAMDQKLSVIIITRNESHNLPDCIRSVAFADEIIVVDSSSTDGTQQIARDMGDLGRNHAMAGFWSPKKPGFVQSQV